MLIGIYADAHFSLNSSILLGSTGSTEGRLDSLIKSFKWMYEKFREAKVNLIVDLGDIADSNILRSEEITAISKALSYNDSIPEYHLLGNHERLTQDGSINSVNFIDNIKNHKLIKNIITAKDLNLNDLSATFIPYSSYSNDSLKDFPDNDIAFSHIDIFGADTGGWTMKSGIDPIKLSKKYKLVINGHIHKHSWVYKNKIMNLGSISGQNFSSSGKSYIGILDTETLKIQLIENPYALNFVKKTAKSMKDIIKLLSDFDDGKQYNVQLKVPLDLVDDARNLIKEQKNITASRILTTVDNKTLDNLNYEDIERVDDINSGFDKLREFINKQEELPYKKDDMLKIVDILEKNEL